MSYFRELPNISYVSRFSGSNRNDERIEVKNLFKRAKLRGDIDAAITAFTYYKIKEGDRPDIIAKKIYNDSELDWVILITNNITNVRNQWPLDNESFKNYLLSKYGTGNMTDEQKYAALNEVKHYETTEVRDEYQRIILNKGMIVDKDFAFTYTSEVDRNKEISETILMLPSNVNVSKGDTITQPAIEVSIPQFGGDNIKFKFTGASGIVKQTVDDLTEVRLTKVVGNFLATPNGSSYQNPLLVNGQILGIPSNPKTVIPYYKTNTTPYNLNPVRGVSNYDYEVEMNEEKRKIKLLRPEYLSTFITDMRNVMKYSRSTQYINQRVKQTYNPSSIGV